MEIKIHVDTEELDKAIEKANRLVDRLKEIRTLNCSLGGIEQKSET